MQNVKEFIGCKLGRSFQDNQRWRRPCTMGSQIHKLCTWSVI